MLCAITDRKVIPHKQTWTHSPSLIHAFDLAVTNLVTLLPIPYKFTFAFGNPERQTFLSLVLNNCRKPPSMAVDDSFKKPGAVPFKWEVKPGVPRAQQNHPRPKSMPLSSPPPMSPSRAQSFDRRRSSELSSTKLRPPPAGYYMFSPVEPRAKSFRSSPRIRSERWRFERPLLARPESVSTGCFLSPLLRRMTSRKKPQKPVVLSDYTSDLETSSKSLSPFHDSRTSCSSSRSNMSSPRPRSDPEWAWAGYGLF
ncbi:uncharacterized protein LOC114716700 [Neltuma alba]|uniref:uncharacterized protein LOC114716700 n=1 Tax=Neltuma alba TaxID=207710 RepID=UPI0010A2F5D7|nr:uncharacterized protein LOC114716700 [Prosopis alba]